MISSLRQVLVDFAIMFGVVFTIILLYTTYSQDLFDYLFGEQTQTVFVDNIALRVSYADTEPERIQGLSGVDHLSDTGGKLFFFDEPNYYRMWMKDMLIPIDIIWIDENMKVIHIEENVKPESFPATYTSTKPARFVLETNAFFTKEYDIRVGSQVTIPAADLPRDLVGQLR